MTACVAMEAKRAKPRPGNAVAKRGRSWSACLAVVLLAGATLANPADERTPTDHLSPAAEQAMWQEIQGNLAVLRQQSLLPMPTSPTAVGYQFPLRLAPGLPDFAGHRVSAFADHNPTAGAVLDYNGGSRTYDGHRGTDIALTPFNWNKVDAGDMQAVAAAAGTIAGKSNVDATDHNPCDGGSNADPWNYVTVVHADGTMTIYGHLRYNSLTGKSIGQTVAQGEYLGTAASSGNSSGPHLHFEVRFGSYSSAEWTDPYAGPNSQPQSLWLSQRPYLDSAINRLSTHSSPPSTANACAQTITHLQDSFSTPQNVYFYAFFRDYQGALPAQLAIYRPDGSTFQSWQYTTATAFASAWTGSWLYNFPAGSAPGTWRFEAIYNGASYSTFFNVDAPTSITVTSPNGAENWDHALPHAINWTDNIGGEVNIDLDRNDVAIARLASNAPSNGVFLWTPDAALTLGPGYRVRVSSVTAPSLADSSDASFTLSNDLYLFSDSFETSPLTPP